MHVFILFKREIHGFKLLDVCNTMLHAHFGSAALGRLGSTGRGRSHHPHTTTSCSTNRQQRRSQLHTTPQWRHPRHEQVRLTGGACAGGGTCRLKGNRTSIYKIHSTICRIRSCKPPILVSHSLPLLYIHVRQLSHPGRLTRAIDTVHVKCITTYCCIHKEMASTLYHNSRH